MQVSVVLTCCLSKHCMRWHSRRQLRRSDVHATHRMTLIRNLNCAIFFMLPNIVRTAAVFSTGSCPAGFNDSSSSSIQPTLDSAQQIAILSQRLEDTQNLLHFSQAHSPKSSFRYGTFLSGMLVALLLVVVAAFLSWSYIQQKLQRKQQVAVVGGLKDMDDTTLKKVLGEVGTTFHSTCCSSVLLSLLTPTSLLYIRLAQGDACCASAG